jgi:hypothetical protein
MHICGADIVARILAKSVALRNIYKDSSQTRSLAEHFARILAKSVALRNILQHRVSEY